MDGPCTVRLVVSTRLRTIILVDTDARTVELVQRAVRCLNDAPRLEVFSDPDAVRRYLLDTKLRPGAIVLNGEREGTLTLMSWINNAIDTPVVYFGRGLSLPHFYRVLTITNPPTADGLRDALREALAIARPENRLSNV